MTSTLHDQLGRLAERAGDPVPGVDRPSGRELWERGVRHRRRVRRGTAAIVGSALAALALIVGIAAHRATPPSEPEPAQAPVGIPSRIHTPSAWLPGTGDAGPLGQVVAVLGAQRRSWTGSEQGLVAVSAATGEYRFLDLPGESASGDVALSPDGRHLAYWSTGPTSGTPNTSEGDAPVASVTVYDTATGSTRVAPVETEHGVEPELLFWVDDRRLAFSHYQYVGGDDDSQMAQSSGNDPSWWWWDLSEEAPGRWAEGERGRIDAGGLSTNGRTATIGRGGFWFFGTPPPTGVRPARVPGSTLLNATNVAVSPDGTRVAGIWNGGRMPNDLTVVPLGPYRPDDHSGARVDGTGESFEVEGWTDADHVAVTRRSPPVGGSMGMALYELDAGTGEATRMVRLPRGYSAVQWASDLLSAPVVDRPAPPRPLDPRLVTGLGVTVVLAAGLGLWGWRRRVAP